MILPDILFYAKLITELVDWSTDAKSVPSWATTDTACGIWQFATHAYPILYASFLLAIVFHAFVTLFLDYSGGYELRIKRFLVVIFIAICTIIALIVAPSAFYGKAKWRRVFHLRVRVHPLALARYPYFHETLFYFYS